jgi:hypothetical protein
MAGVRGEVIPASPQLDRPILWSRAMPRFGVSRPVLAISLGLALAGCNDATDPEIQRVIGTIDPSHTVVPVIVAPDEARAHVPFTVIVHTVGTSDCTKPDGNDLVVLGDVARIVPYDVVPIPGHSTVCRNDYAFQEHRLSVTLPRTGAARVRVVGLSASTRQSVLDSVEVTVRIRG